MVRTLIPTMLLVTWSTLAQAADWPTYMNNNARNGFTEEGLKAPLVLQWEYSAPAAVQKAWAGPRAEPIEGMSMRPRMTFDDAIDVAAVGGQIFFGSSVDHQIYALDAKTGQVQWNYFTEGPIRLAPTVWQGKVYVGSDDGNVYCLNAKDGSLVWKYRVGLSNERVLARGNMISRWPVRTGILIVDGTAYFGAGVFPHETVYLCAVKADDGTLVWRNDTVSEQDAQRNDLTPQGYLLAEGDLLFVPSGRNLPVAFNRHTGEIAHKRSFGWRGEAGGEVGGTKAVLADGQIYAQGSQHFLAMEQKSGNVGHGWIDGHHLAVDPQRAYMVNGAELKGVHRADYAKASGERLKLKAKLKALSAQRTSLKAEDYKAKLDELNDQYEALQKIGVLWTQPHRGDAVMMVAGNWVLVGGENEVAAFNTNTGEQVWKHTVVGMASGLAAAGGQLLVSTDQGKLYAFATSADTTAARHPAARPNPFTADPLAKQYEAAAQEIIDHTGVKSGFCLVLGSEQGGLAAALAAKSKLNILGLEPDAAKVEASRKALSQAGLYGHRVIIAQGDLNSSPYSNYFANLIVSDTLLLTGKLPAGSAENIARHIKPCGGIVCLGGPENTAGGKLSTAEVEKLLASLELDEQGKVAVKDRWGTLTRGQMPGAGSWSHQYGDAGNTNLSQDQMLRGGLRVLWYGDPGPTNVINRHEAAAAPLSTNGRMFVQGTEKIYCYDAYNGQFLWEYANPGAIRTGVFYNAETSNLAATDDYLFVAVNDTCTQLDAATGQVVRVHRPPAAEDDIPRVWGFVAVHDGQLYGTSTIRTELERQFRRRGLTIKSATDSLFAVDIKSGEKRWTYRGGNVLHVTISIGGGKVCFIDSTLSATEREELLKEDKSALKLLTGEEAKKAEEELKNKDVRLAVALDAKTGTKLWSQAVDVTDCSKIGIGGGQLTMMYHEGKLVVCGANANGHYWKQFLSGEFSQRRLLVLNAETGEKMWAKDANYRHRPVIVGREILAEPWGFDLETGAEKKRVHPLTGEESVWQFCRPGHHCGTITATPNMLFFRSGSTAYYDLYSDSGTQHFAGQRLGCWVNAIPGNGLLMVPEASAGCVCLFSIASTVVMEPQNEKKGWGIFSAGGSALPVKNLALNLGAPGDRRDEQGRLWLAYPRPASREGLDLALDIKPQIAKGGGYYYRTPESLKLTQADPAWVYSSGAKGLTRAEVPLLDVGQGPANYTVTLYFAELDNQPAGSRVFDIKLQGKRVAGAVDLSKTPGVQRGSLQKFEHISVNGNLLLELVPKGSDSAPPILSAIVIAREDDN